MSKAKIVAAAILTSGLGAAGKLTLEKLPPAIQAAVKAQVGKATLVGLSSEIEGGKTMYEVETKANGKSRDLLLDAKGALVEAEEEVDLDSIPAAAKSAIQKKAGKGKIEKVERVTVGAQVSYEAAYKNLLGKSVEVGVNADGSAHK